jgi:hypothetical protein
MTRNRRKLLVFAVAALLVFLAMCAGCSTRRPIPPDGATLRILDWKTGQVYRESPIRPGDRLFFGWVHSLEKIPWNEYYHIAENPDGTFGLILDSITFPAFGAGIPEDKGAVCYVKDGLIHMEQINQRFDELSWLNSHFATRDILLSDQLVAKGSDLPEHTRLRLTIQRR